MSEPQPILFVIDQFRNPFAGTEGQLYQLVKHLDPERFNPHLLVLTDSDYLREEGFPCDYTVLGSQKVASPFTWALLGRLARRFRRQGYRMAHVFFNDASLLCPPVFRLFGIRTVISRRDMGYWYTPGLLRALRITGRFVSAVLTNSQAVANLTHDKEHIPWDRISVIYNGVVDRSEERGEIPELSALKAQGHVIAILVANIRPIKRIEDAIAAIQAVSTRLHLVVVGDGDASVLQRYALEQQVVERVHFLGGRDDVPVCLRYADIGLLCSQSEGFSNSVVEYMQQGLPVICTATGGNPEAITHGETGFLYSVGDTDMLALHLDDLVGDDEKRRQLGRKAREEAAHRFSVDALIQNHQRFYDLLLASDDHALNKA